jgi:hypothetical protein
MTRDEYLRLYNRINLRHDESLKLAIKRIKTKLAAERRRDLDGLSRMWLLDNNTPPPPVDEDYALQATDAENGETQAYHTNSVLKPFRTRNDKIRRAVRLVEGDEVSQPIVMKKLKAEFPEAAEGLAPTLISKVLRWLEDHGALVTVSMGSPKSPRIYRKTELINRF